MAAVHPPLLREHRFTSMGTECSVLTPAGHPDAAGLVTRLFAEWDERYSRFKPTSELSRLNASAGTPTRVSEPMFGMLEAALAAARATNGIFDPLLGHRMVELGYDRTFAELPSRRDARSLDDWQPGAWQAILLDADGRAVTIPAGTGIDLGGIAKGMAVDAGLGLLVDAGLPFASVNAGGDMAVHGIPTGMSGWPIAIELSPGRERVVTLPSGALATSSILRRRWRTDGAERHHLLDPRTGMPTASGLLQASVAAASCRQAEIAAKAALVSGLAAGTDFLERNGLAALLLTDDGAEWRVGRWTS